MLPLTDSNTPIFITGGTGKVGRVVLAELWANGYHNIRALYRKRYSASDLATIHDGVEWVEGHVLDSFMLEEALADRQVIIHCAAIISFKPGDRARMMQINIQGTANLVNIALDLGIKRFIHISSVAAIGRQPQIKLIDEHSMWNASNRNSSYSQSKFLSEQEVWRGMAEGLSVAIVNPSVIIGGSLPTAGGNALIDKVKMGIAFCPPGKIGMVDVKDVAKFTVLLIQQGTENERYILNAANISYNDLFTYIDSVKQRKKNRMQISSSLMMYYGKFSGIWQRLFGGKGLNTDMARSSCNLSEWDNRKSLQIEGFDYRDIKESIGEVVRKV